jgi:hypothetical protein
VHPRCIPAASPKISSSGRFVLLVGLGKLAEWGSLLLLPKRTNLPDEPKFPNQNQIGHGGRTILQNGQFIGVIGVP